MISGFLLKVGTVEAHRSQFADISKASNQFQAELVKSMVQEMRKGLDSEFSKMAGSSIYEDEINSVLANKISADSHLGLSHLLFNQMANLQLEQDFNPKK